MPGASALIRRPAAVMSVAVFPAVWGLYVGDFASAPLAATGLWWVFVFFAPGYLLQAARGWSGRRPLLELAALGFGITFLIMLPLCLAAYLGHWRIATVGRAMLLLPPGAAVLYWALRWRRGAGAQGARTQAGLREDTRVLSAGSGGVTDPASGSRGGFFAFLLEERHHRWLVPLFVAGVAVFGYYLRGYVSAHVENDLWFDLAFMRKLAERPVVEAGDIFTLGGGINPVYGFNPWHLMLAALAQVGNVDVIDVWMNSIPFYTFLFAGAFFFFVRRAFDDERTAFLAVLLLVGFTAFHYRRGMAEFLFGLFPPGLANKVVLLLAAGALVRSFKAGGRTWLVLGAAWGASLLSLSPTTYFGFMLSLAVFWLILPVLGAGGGRARGAWGTHSRPSR